jgi:hypothetical protein
MGGEMKKPFKFLNPEEFSALTGKEKEIYLSMAAQELEMRQRTLREQMRKLPKEEQDSKE